MRRYLKGLHHMSTPQSAGKCPSKVLPCHGPWVQLDGCTAAVHNCPVLPTVTADSAELLPAGFYIAVYVHCCTAYQNPEPCLWKQALLHWHACPSLCGGLVVPIIEWCDTNKH
jgi:hypothetical protein